MIKKALLIICLSLSFAYADKTIEVVKKVTSTVRIFVEVDSDSPALKSFSKKILKMIQADLKIVGVFKIVGNKSKKSDYHAKVKITKQSKDIRGTFIVVNSAGKTIFHKTYTLSKKERYPFLAHRFVVELSEKFGIKDVAWMDKLVVFTRLVASGESDILISDYSLTFKKTVVKNGINVFPKWANKEQNAFYFTKFEKTLSLYKFDLYTGKKKKILSGNGMLVCGDVSRDGRKLLLTMAVNGQPDIFEFDVVRKTKRRLTHYNGIDVNAKYIEKDKSFVFVSDRFGYPEIFKGSVHSKIVEQLVFKGRNNNYVDGFKDYVLFVSRDTNSEFGRNTFNVYLISTKTDYIRQLTSTGQNFFPRFSEDGNTILYIKNFRNESGLGVIRLNQNKSFVFPLKDSKIQSIDW